MLMGSPSSCESELPVDLQLPRKSQERRIESQQSPVHLGRESDVASCASDTDDGEYETSSEGPLKNSQSKQRTESSTSGSSEPLEKSSVCCVVAYSDSAVDTLVNTPTQTSIKLSGASSSSLDLQDRVNHGSPRLEETTAPSALKSLGPMETWGLEDQAKPCYKRKEVKCDIRITEKVQDISTKDSLTDTYGEAEFSARSFSFQPGLDFAYSGVEVRRKPGGTSDLKALLRIDDELGPLRRQLSKITGMFKALHQTGFSTDLQTQPPRAKTAGFASGRVCQEVEDPGGKAGSQLPGYAVMTKAQVVQEEQPNTRSLGDGQSCHPPDGEPSWPIDGASATREIRDAFVRSPRNPVCCDVSVRKAGGQSTDRSDRERSSWPSQRTSKPESRERLSHPYQDSDYEVGMIEPDRRVPRPSCLCRSCRRRSGRNSFCSGKFFDFRNPASPLGGSEANRAGLHGARHHGAGKKTLTGQEKLHPSSSPRWNEPELVYRTAHHRTRPHASRNQVRPRETPSKNNHTSTESFSCTQSFSGSLKTGGGPAMIDGMCSAMSSVTGMTSTHETHRSKKEKRHTSKVVTPITSFVLEREERTCKRATRLHRYQDTQDIHRTSGQNDRTRHENGHRCHGIGSWVSQSDKGVTVKPKYRVPASSCEVAESKSNLKVQRSGFSLKCEEEQLVFDSFLETLLKSSHSKDRLDPKSPGYSDLSSSERRCKFIVLPVVFTNGVPEPSKTRLLSVSKFSSVKHILTKCTDKMLKLEGSSHGRPLSKHPDAVASISAKLREGSGGVQKDEYRLATASHGTSCSRHARPVESKKWRKLERSKCPQDPQPNSPYAPKKNQCSEGGEAEKVRKVVPGLRCSPEDFLYDT